MASLQKDGENVSELELDNPEIDATVVPDFPESTEDLEEDNAGDDRAIDSTRATLRATNAKKEQVLLEHTLNSLQRSTELPLIWKLCLFVLWIFSGRLRAIRKMRFEARRKKSWTELVRIYHKSVQSKQNRMAE
ncbi:unnamed protein product [Lymnaea stagnalis]|uniref:Uncharacterized protein n=1 Tax=Lymnaea stagnalis TaxID=6523 RepID=A0AAV2H183_LYMST